MTANDIQGLFDEVVFKYPDINPETFSEPAANPAGGAAGQRHRLGLCICGAGSPSELGPGRPAGSGP